MKIKGIATLSALAFCCLLTFAGPTWADDGTVTINGLVWLKNPASCLGTMTWDQAKSGVPSFQSGACSGRLKDGSKAGDWRLPTKDELAAVYGQKSKLGEVRDDYYWTSTEAFGGASAYMVNMKNGNSSTMPKTSQEYSLPVRSPRP
ncbi:MAG: DUF1566 domain-containing protein [Deltaproteobacteria bacterium]|nr:DUF1566 domain-containing protein [Deltaproteobacteria bacterium]